jgi:hypothetical protein
MFIIPNRDFVSTEVYLKNREKYYYNSFIFGSSRTVAFKTKAWLNYLGADSIPFVFDASGESVFGIYKKVLFVDNLGDDIKNCLIVLCTDTSFSHGSDQNGHLFIKHPRVVGTSWIGFYSEFFKAYLDPKFFSAFTKYFFTREYDVSMRRFIETSKIHYDVVSNDIFLVDKDNYIEINANAYYESISNIFYDRRHPIKFAKQQISDQQLNMLEAIKYTFEKHHTKFKIVISPLYDQVQINPSDLNILKNIFGNQNVFDYSGKNCITENRYNYYEDKHYRPLIGDKIIHDLYTQATSGEK